MNDPRIDWHARARALTPATRAFIAGDWCEAASGAQFETVNPATGRATAIVAACGAADADRAVASASAAFAAGHWSTAAPAARKAVLLRLADLIERDRDHLALLETLDTGKPIRDSLTIDLPATLRCLRWFAEATDKLYDEVAPTAGSVLAMIRRRPLGVVAAIVPWNFPLVTAMTKIAPALAAGNSVVLKPSELSPLSALHLAGLGVEAGLPPGVLNVLPGIGPDVGRALALHMDVAALLFTGSTAVGKLLMGYAAQSNLKPVALECGGKSANIVLRDVPDMDRAIAAAAAGVFQNQGQICNAGTRLVLDAPIHDAFLDGLLRVTETYRPGDPLDPDTRLGPLVSAAHAGRVRGHIAEAEAEGAQRLTPATIDCPPSLQPDALVPATVFANVTPGMGIARNEVFGPVLAVLRAEGLDQAIRLANDSAYGLAAGIWTANVSAALAAEHRLDTGFLWINTLRAGDISVPFGGVRQSGFGRDKSLHAFDHVTQRKSIWLDLATTPGATR